MNDAIKMDNEIQEEMKLKKIQRENEKCNKFKLP